MVKDDKVYLSQEALSKFRKEYEELTLVRRPQAVERVAESRVLGDLEENSDYTQAKQDLAFIDGRIAELEKILKTAKIIATLKEKPDLVIIGSTVVVEIEGEIDEFQIVGSLEADPAKGKISNESPVGQALLGAKVGEVIEVTTPIVRAKYKILEIK